MLQNEQMLAKMNRSLAQKGKEIHMLDPREMKRIEEAPDDPEGIGQFDCQYVEEDE